MKAILVPSPGGPEALVWGDAPEPRLVPGEVVVRVRATAVNRADLLQAAGKYPPPPGASEILGMEGAGEVEGSGEQMCFLLPGGGYAERVAVPRGMLMPIPSGMSFEEAAAIPEVWLTAYLNLFREAGLKVGETALIHAGASGVGTAAIQLAKRAGARVVATVRTPEKTAALRALGADLVVESGGKEFAAAITAALGPTPVDVVLDPVGGETLGKNVSLMKVGGRLIVIATMGGGTGTLDLRILLVRRLRLVGSTLRARPLDEKIDLTAAFVRDVLPGFRDGSLKPVIDKVFSLPEASEAHRWVAANRNVGKVVLKVG